MPHSAVRLAVDIGGTFTDLALASPSGLLTNKVLTTPREPARGVLDGVEELLAQGAVRAADIQLVVHGTTLATNALIERRGARTALVVTEGLRDSLEMAQENRFAQYDISSNRPSPLVPRHLRLPVRERLGWRGDVLTPLDERSVDALIPTLEAHGIEALAVGLIHAYANPAHEQRVREIVAAALPDLYISLASEVCPEIREYERQSTTCANAYVQPLMAQYLTALAEGLEALGLDCPLLMMSSAGTLMGLDAARRFPIRLVESGPAGGAILATQIAADEDLDSVLSFDMGGTTAKICLIDDAQALTSRSFEVAREYRFMKGSGLPVRIPVIEMVEIGAGGGSLASVDALARIAVGPRSAGSEPGPACYGRGGEHAAVTDADLVLGKLDPARFAGGRFALDVDAARAALAQDVATPLDIGTAEAAYGIAEVVEENMASAARMHAVEWGEDVRGRVLIAFGGAAPLHAARLAAKLEITRVVVPRGAGVGSAIGFLRAPVAYEVVRSRYARASEVTPQMLSAVFADLREEALALVRSGAPDAPLAETRLAYMRYVGQGHEIAVPVDDDAGAGELRAAFEAAYTRLFGRTIPDLETEVLSWTLSLAAPETPIDWGDGGAATDARPAGTSPAGGVGAQGTEARKVDAGAVDAGDEDGRGIRPMFDQASGRFVDAVTVARETLRAGGVVHGPALIEEDQTTTVVPTGFTARRTGNGHLLLEADGGSA